jgi:uncharacterized repeat protein (TIGR02543 family)
VVTFDSQGGDVASPVSTTVAYDSPYGALATTARSGYTFAGWWTAPGGAGTMVSAGTVVKITADQTLYANWTPTTCLVTFDAQGGSAPSPASKSVTLGSAYGALATTTLTGYTFAGWWTAPDGAGTKVTAGTIVALAADHTLYANWTLNTYVVSFDAQGGEAASPASTTVAYDSPYGPLAATTRSGYTFAGWWTGVGGTGTQVSDGNIVKITADQMLYAKWTANSYAVTFDGQGGSVPNPAIKSVAFDAPYGALATTILPGYTFAGWWTEAGGAGTMVTAATLVTETNDHTLHADWAPNSYRVTFDAQGGSVPDPANKNVQNDSPYGPLATTTRSGYTFAGWWTGVGGTGTQVSDGNVVTVTANQTLYAKWTATSCTVTFDGQGGSVPNPANKSVAFDSPYGALAATTFPGYTFAGWWTGVGGAGTMVTALSMVTRTNDHTLYANWTSKTYVLTFDAQGGAVANPASTLVMYDGTYGPLAITTRSGYTFAGWWTGVGGTGAQVSEGNVVKITADQTLYAKWTANSYTVTFDAQGGSVPNPANKSVAFEVPYGALATTTLPGYTFAGWWTEPGGAGTMVTAVTIATRTNDHTLYAHWTPNSYTVTFDPQGGSVPDPVSKIIQNDSPYGTLPATTRSGFAFGGWWTGVGGTGTQVSDGTVVAVTGDQRLYAKWMGNTFTVAFDAQGGEEPNPSSMNVTLAESYGKLAATTRPGYTFTGWWTEADGAGMIVTAGTVVTVSSDHTLYAKWTANSSTVTFDAQGGSSPSPASKSVAYDSLYGALPTTTRSGYTFAGWWTEAEGEGAMVTSGSIVAATNHHTVYANWAPNAYTVTFDGQGGSVPSPSSISAVYGLPYGDLPAPTRWGCNFLGWWTGVGGTGSEVTPGTVCKVAADQTLYAKWGTTGQIRFVMPDFIATEGYSLRVYVERVNGSNGVASVNYKTKPQTALDWLDFIPKNGTLTWTNGEAGIKKIKIPVLADGLAERYESFRVLLKKPVGATLASESEATVIIPANVTKAGDGVTDATAVRMTKLTKALGDGSLTWFSSAQAPWIRQTLVTADGLDAAMSGVTSGGQASWLQTDVDGAGKLKFSWRLTGTGRDTCLVLVDGVVRCTLGAGFDWAPQALKLGAGEHTVRWVFVSDIGVAGGAAYLDQVRWMPEHE